MSLNVCFGIFPFPFFGGGELKFYGANLDFLSINFKQLCFVCFFNLGGFSDFNQKIVFPS